MRAPPEREKKRARIIVKVRLNKGATKVKKKFYFLRGPKLSFVGTKDGNHNITGLK